MAPEPPARAERRAIVSESRVRVSDETEEVPVRDGEVGEADVVGEFDEPEESGAAGELGGTGDAGLAGDAAPVADSAPDGAAVDGDGAVVDGTGAAVDGTGAPVNGNGAAADGAGEPDPVAQFTAELRQLPGEWYVVHSYAGYENRVKANLESRTQSLNMDCLLYTSPSPRDRG